MVPAIIGSILYCVFTFVSIIHYPEFYSPLTNFLSTLGNSSLNPSGAIFYNLGMIQAGILVIPFYVGLYRIFHDTKGNRILPIALLWGIINGISIMMSGVFSEDIYALHCIWGLLIFISFIPVLFLTNIMLIQKEGVIKGVSVYGFAVGVIDTTFVVYVLFFGTGEGSILEWITVFSFLLWVVAIAIILIWKHRTN